MWFAVRGRRFAFGEKRDALSCLVGEAGSFPPLAGEGLKAPPTEKIPARGSSPRTTELACRTPPNVVFFVQSVGDRSCRGVYKFDIFCKRPF